MGIWRLVTHHLYATRMLETYRSSSCIALGWGKVGDLSLLRPSDPDAIAKAIQRTYPGLRNSGAGGRCLWCFYHKMQDGDLVILGVGNGPERDVVKVTGPYEWTDTPIDGNDYSHYRRVQWTNLDGKELWRQHRLAPGCNRRWALIRLI